MTSRPSIVRLVAEAVLAGVLLGTAARVAMRVLVWLAGTAGGFSRGGSVEIVVFGAILGAPVALAVLAIRQWRGWQHPWVGVWTALTLYLAAVARPSPSAQDALASSPLPAWQIVFVFGTAFLAFGLWIDMRWHAMTGRRPPLTLRASLAALAMPGIVAGVVPALIVGQGSPTASAPPVAVAAGCAIAAAGLFLLLTCIVGFAKEGEGTLAPYDPPQALVIRGPYRYTRNPMYVGVLAILGGLALARWSGPLAIYAAGVAAAFVTFVRVYEEPRLERQFGDSYRRYKSRVPRWLGPVS